MIRGLRVIAALGAALALSGCISLFPKSDPVRLYRLDAAAADSRVAAPAGGKVGVLKFPTTFPRAAAGDRILAVNGDTSAFVADSRWVAPAQVMFDEAAARAFDGDGATRLIGRGEGGQAALVLRLDMRNFEADYRNGPKAAPTAVIRLRASITRSFDRKLIAEKLFEAEVPASANRVSAIVAAFNRAVGGVLAELVAWTDAAGVAVTPA